LELREFQGLAVDSQGLEPLDRVSGDASPIPQSPFMGFPPRVLHAW